ncbi:MAG: hypothetical protein AAF928_13700 [Myxococcota bacterium]
MFRPCFIFTLLAGGGIAASACSLDLATADGGRSLNGGFGGAGSGTVAGTGGGIETEFTGSGGGDAPLTFADLCGGGQATCQPGPEGQCSAPSAPGDDAQGGAGGGGAAPGGDDDDAGASEGDCKLTYDDGAVAGVCTTGDGTQEADEPCLRSADCGPGLGCDASGLCRPYCCGDVEACPEQTYCAPQPMAEADAGDAVPVPLIPVCVPSDDCMPRAENDLCPDGLTCTIVREDGTTACVVPGPGETGDACPCAEGHACQPSTGTCVELCLLGRAESCAPGFTCQSSNNGNDVGFCIEI